MLLQLALASASAAGDLKNALLRRCLRIYVATMPLKTKHGEQWSDRAYTHSFSNCLLALLELHRSSSCSCTVQQNATAVGRDSNAGHSCECHLSVLDFCFHFQNCWCLD